MKKNIGLFLRITMIGIQPRILTVRKDDQHVDTSLRMDSLESLSLSMFGQGTTVEPVRGAPVFAVKIKIL